MWDERYLIVVAGFRVPLMPYDPRAYAPIWVEWSILAGAIALFALIITVFAKLFPVVSVWEVVEHRGPEPPVATTRFRMPGRRVAAVIATLLARLPAVTLAQGDSPLPPVTQQGSHRTFSVAIPVATRRQALAFRGTDQGSQWAPVSSGVTAWRGLAGLVTESPLPHTDGHSRPFRSSDLALRTPFGRRV